jgi:hypothetical protein
MLRVKRRRALRITVIVVAAAACLAVIGWYLAHRAAENAAKSLAEIGSELTVPVKGAFGQILLEGVPKDQVADVLPGEGLAALLSNSKSHPNTEGILEAYQKDPRKFQQYAAVFDTWYHALAVNDAVQRLAANTPVPPTSASMNPHSPQYRLDAWGHPFCIFLGTEQTAIVSAGPDGKGFTSCNEVRLTRAQIDRLPVVPITCQPSGALIMVFKQKR